MQNAPVDPGDKDQGMDGFSLPTPFSWLEALPFFWNAQIIPPQQWSALF